MNAHILFVAALVIVPAVGLVIWSWLAMAQVEDDLRAISGFEGLHFDI